MKERIPLNPLQKALVALLSGDSALAATGITGVFDKVPTNTAYPYVVVGQTSGGQEGTKDGFSPKDVLATILVYSNEEGYLELNAIMDAVVQAMTREPYMTLENNFSLELSDISSWRAEPQIDRAGEEIRRGIINQRFLISDRS